MEIRLPFLPPSANTLVRPCLMRGREDGRPIIRLVSTREADQFRKKAHALIPVAPVLMSGPLEVYVTFYVPTLASDASNRQKALEDALNGRIWYDDKQIAEIHSVKVVTGDPEFVGVHLRVEKANPADHPELSARLARSTIQTKENELAQAKLELPAPVRPRPVAPGPPASWSELNAALPGQKPLPENLKDKLARLASPASYPPPEPPKAA